MSQVMREQVGGALLALLGAVAFVAYLLAGARRT
jgi:hypothetical protein